MTPDQLLIFAAVAEHANISRAAQAVHRSQPAVTAHLRQLEASCGEPLYQRHGRGIRLTPAGEALAAHARAIAAVWTHAQDWRRALRGLETGVLSIGATTTPASYRLPYLLRGFASRYPHLKVQTREGNTADILVAREQFDLALIEGEPETPLPATVRIVPWLRDEIVAIVPAAHRWARQDSVTLPALASEALVMRERGSGVRHSVEAAFAALGLAPRVELEVAGVEAVKEAVRAGMGVGFVSALSMREASASVACLRIGAEAGLTRRFSILVPAGERMSHAARAFLALCEDASKLENSTPRAL